MLEICIVSINKNQLLFAVSEKAIGFSIKAIAF